MTPFVHLNVHSEYSLVDSTVRIKPLVARAAALGQPALAITDVNNLFAAVKFYRAADGAGIKPILGAELDVANGNEPASRLTLLCRNHQGYLTLSRLITRMWMEGHRTDGVVLRPEWLRADRNGLFLLAGRQSPAAKLLHDGKDDLALAWLADWQAEFGDDLFLALSRCGHADDAHFNPFALHASGRRGIPVVATNAVEFLDADGFDAHEARVCIATKHVLADPRRPKLFTPEQYLKDGDAMAALFEDAPDAIANSVALAQACNVHLSLGKVSLPAFPVPDDETVESWLRRQAREGLQARLERQPLAPGKTREDYDARLETELDVIIRMDFPGYFLIVADFINWSKDHGIPVGPGRGSGAGSLVAWALGITDLDPLPYDLLFERFLNPERVSMPDFDIDFCMDRRDEVIEYVSRKYGRDRVSQIITYGTMAAKAAVRDTGRVLGHPFPVVDGISKLIPNVLGIGLPDALGLNAESERDPEKRKKLLENKSEELRQRYDEEDDVRDHLDLAMELEDLTRNAGKHAGGVVIAPSPLSDFCPLYAEHDEGTLGRNPVTQFDKDDVEAVGLVKFDFLGLRTLTIIDWAVKSINRRRAASNEPLLDIALLELTDAPTYRLFARGQTVAVFQFESAGMRKMLVQAKPDTFEDLIALVSLYRPGPMDLIPSFVARKHGEEAIEYPHALLEPVLAPTYGVVVYQEQVMQTAQILAGYSLGGADILRRAMGKKKPEEMVKERAKFEAGALEHHGIEPRQSGPIFDLLEKFAGYGFNKSHAAAYSLVAYQTAWLKVHYPADFMAATLSSDMDSTDKVVNFLRECAALELEVLPPHVNASNYRFDALDTRTIRYGLGAIKGVGQGICDAISAARTAAGPFRDLADFLQRLAESRISRNTFEALVNAGALDGLADTRASLLGLWPSAAKALDQWLHEKSSGQQGLFGGGGTTPDLHIPSLSLPELPKSQLLQREFAQLGHYQSGHPFDDAALDAIPLLGRHLGDLESLWISRTASTNSNGFSRGIDMVIAGMVMEVRNRGDRQQIIKLEDGHGVIEVLFFNDAAAEFAHLLTRDRPLLIQGSLNEDRFNGGLNFRAKQAWDFDLFFARYARHAQLSVDLGAADINSLNEMLREHRNGPVTLRWDLRLPDGTRGVVDQAGSQGLALDRATAEQLRAQPGVHRLRLRFDTPWD